MRTRFNSDYYWLMLEHVGALSEEEIWVKKSRVLSKPGTALL